MSLNRRAEISLGLPAGANTQLAFRIAFAPKIHAVADTSNEFIRYVT
jgi:hypothetical protein